MVHRCILRFRNVVKKNALLALAQKNARHALLRYKARSSYDDKRINAALLQLESALALEHPPYRIECFDISTIHGKHSVASMVVFTNGRPDKGAVSPSKFACKPMSQMICHDARSV